MHSVALCLSQAKASTFNSNCSPLLIDIVDEMLFVNSFEGINLWLSYYLGVQMIVVLSVVYSGLVAESGHLLYD